jgi:hypothetical protein
MQYVTETVYVHYLCVPFVGDGTKHKSQRIQRQDLRLKGNTGEKAGEVNSIKTYVTDDY